MARMIRLIHTLSASSRAAGGKADRLLTDPAQLGKVRLRLAVRFVDRLGEDALIGGAQSSSRYRGA